MINTLGPNTIKYIKQTTLTLGFQSLYLMFNLCFQGIHCDQHFRAHEMKWKITYFIDRQVGGILMVCSMLLINGLMTQYTGVAMGEKLMVQKMVLAN